MCDIYLCNTCVYISLEKLLSIGAHCKKPILPINLKVGFLWDTLHAELRFAEVKLQVDLGLCSRRDCDLLLNSCKYLSRLKKLAAYNGRRFYPYLSDHDLMIAGQHILEEMWKSYVIRAIQRGEHILMVDRYRDRTRDVPDRYLSEGRVTVLSEEQFSPWRGHED